MKTNYNKHKSKTRTNIKFTENMTNYEQQLNSRSSRTKASRLRGQIEPIVNEDKGSGVGPRKKIKDERDVARPTEKTFSHHPIPQ
jgi:hypothetical protein